jgi:hypothetical protein
MTRREHVAVIRAVDRGILMQTMFYASEVRKEPKFKTVAALVADKELGLAVKLIEVLAKVQGARQTESQARGENGFSAATKSSTIPPAGTRSEPTKPRPLPQES